MPKIGRIRKYSRHAPRGRSNAPVKNERKRQKTNNDAKDKNNNNNNSISSLTSTMDQKVNKIANEKVLLNKKLEDVSKKIKELEKEKKSLQDQLEIVDEQWQRIILAQQQEQQAMAKEKVEKERATQSSTDTNNISSSSQDLPVDDVQMYPSEKNKKTGGIGHIILGDGDNLGTSKYGNKDESNNWEDYDVAPPPPPSKLHYQKFGIVYSHGSLEQALKKAKSGDRIYLEETGVDTGYTGDADSWDLHIKDKDLEIIGLGTKPEETLVYLCKKISVDGTANVRIANIMFRYGKASIPGDSDDNDDEDNPLLYIGSEKAKLFLDNCVFDMGTEEAMMRKYEKYYHGPKDLLHRGMVSGIHIDAAEAVVLNGCRFTGGCGSSILYKFDPYEHGDMNSKALDIIQCTFSNTGIASAAEKMKTPTMSQHSSSTKHSGPGLGTIELWRVHRDKEDKLNISSSSVIPIRLIGNTISHNFHSPISCHSLAAHDYGYGSSSMENTVINILKAEEEMKTEKKEGLSQQGRRTCLVGKSYEISFWNNTIQNNGFGLDKTMRVAVAAEHEEKTQPKKRGRRAASSSKSMTAEENNNTIIPNGDTVLAIQGFSVDIHDYNDPYSKHIRECSMCEHCPAAAIKETVYYDDFEEEDYIYYPY